MKIITKGDIDNNYHNKMLSKLVLYLQKYKLKRKYVVKENLVKRVLKKNIKKLIYSDSHRQ